MDTEWKIFYHGSPDPELIEVQDEGLFDGLFASWFRDVAMSHGDHIYKIKVASNRLLTGHELNYEIKWDRIHTAFKAVSTYTGDNLDAVLDAVLADEMSDDAWDAIGGDRGEASWEVQRLRGKLARKLGYDAVEMTDEHGGTVLVLPGVELVFEQQD